MNKKSQQPPMKPSLEERQQQRNEELRAFAQGFMKEAAKKHKVTIGEMVGRNQLLDYIRQEYSAELSGAVARPPRRDFSIPKILETPQK